MKRFDLCGKVAIDPATDLREAISHINREILIESNTNLNNLSAHQHSTPAEAQLGGRKTIALKRNLLEVPDVDQRDYSQPM